MDYIKAISIAGLTLELIGIVLLFRSESFVLKEKNSAEQLREPLELYKEARDNEHAIPKTKPVLEIESDHRAASKNNSAAKIGSRITTAYAFLLLGFIFQCLSVGLS